MVDTNFNRRIYKNSYCRWWEMNFSALVQKIFQRGKQQFFGVFFPRSVVFSPILKRSLPLLLSMLQAEDFYPVNWESVTWRIVSNTYVRGHVVSSCIPPPSYIDWVMKHLDLNYDGAINIVNAVADDGKPLWKLTIRQSGDTPIVQQDQHPAAQ